MVEPVGNAQVWVREWVLEALHLLAETDSMVDWYSISSRRVMVVHGHEVDMVKGSKTSSG